MTLCEQGWEALRADSLSWLLSEERPNLQWRVLIELFGRPADAPAVRRAMGGANAVEPIASLLAELQPDGEWATQAPLWSRYRGPGWRLVAAVQWGADPEDPRLHAASERLLESALGRGGLASGPGRDHDPVLTARTLEAMVALRWGRHERVQEWLAWFEAMSGWEDDPTVCVAVLAVCGVIPRPLLRDRAVEGLARALSTDGLSSAPLGYPNLLRTDPAEVFAVLAGAGVEWRPEWRRALKKLQHQQDEHGRWSRRSPVPKTLGVPKPDQPARWITLKATKALLHYAVAAELPRLFPYPPGAPQP